VKRIFSYLYTLYCLIPFTISFIVALPLYFLIFRLWPAGKSAQIAHKVSRIWAGYLFVVFFIKIKIKNKHYIDPAKTYVFIANHLSLLDIPLYARSCKNTFRFLAKYELTKLPVLGYVINHLYISVKRGDKEDRAKSFAKMMDSLNNNISIFIAPEGTRNKTSIPLLDFRDGAFRLAINSQKALAILTVTDTNRILSPLKFLMLRPGVLHAEWSQPVETIGMNENNLQELKDIAKKTILQVLDKYR
jgi:1-acyl-sn-glycerol-3-phosphate acyltransferase